MDKRLARDLLRSELGSYRSLSYAALVQMLDEPVHKEVVGPDGRAYQIEVQVFWDGKPGDNVRVLASIDDGGWRAFCPLTDDFILSPTGAFVGE